MRAASILSGQIYVCMLLYHIYVCVCVYMYENRRVKSDVEVADEGGTYSLRSDICMYVALSYIHM